MHPVRISLRAACRRALAASLGMFVLFAAVGPVAAVEPIDARDPKPTAPPRSDADDSPRPRPRVTRPRSPATPPPAPSPEIPANPLGYDVSWPQCNDELPESFAFAVVGVNRGRPHSQNDCLVAQLRWAGRDAAFYLNTANPGPRHSSYWPAGQTEPRECDADDVDSADCAYVYGWNAALDGHARVLGAFRELGWADGSTERVPGDATWWLDVETANSWRADRSLNVTTLQGAADYLESVGEEVGFYSTPLLWWRVTGGTDAFDGYPAWHAGARSHEEAEHRCDDPSFTGGELRMVQWVENGIDTNFRCP